MHPAGTMALQLNTLAMPHDAPNGSRPYFQYSDQDVKVTPGPVNAVATYTLIYQSPCQPACGR